jgi:hypothetical protein
MYVLFIASGIVAASSKTKVLLPAAGIGDAPGGGVTIIHQVTFDGEIGKFG